MNQPQAAIEGKRTGGDAGSVTRIEAFSDSVFAFSMTLLVVSTEVPKTIDDLMRALRGFLPFAACFALLSWLWWSHHVFFRRFGSADRITVLLNFILLFFLVFYVYPLKFVANLVFGVAAPATGGGPVVTQGGGVWLMIVYGAGFMGVSMIFAALYGCARHRVKKRGHDARGVYEARTAELAWYANAFVAGVSCVIAIVGGPRALPWSGFSYFLIGPLQAGVYGVRGAREKRAFPESEGR